MTKLKKCYIVHSRKVYETKNNGRTFQNPPESSNVIKTFERASYNILETSKNFRAFQTT